MLFKYLAAGLAYTAAFAAAYTAPPTKGDPSGNDIFTPGLEEAVPVGKPYTITWKPTTTGPITLVFLKGPASNAVAQFPIAENIPNSGSYVWTPPTNLTPGKTGYGILLVDPATGAYQYSTQFGISNDGAVTAPTTTASAVTKTSVAPGPTTSASDDDSEDDDTEDDDATTTASGPTAYPATTSAATATTTTTSLTKPTLAPTVAPVTTHAAVSSGNSSAPTTLQTTATSAAPTRSTAPAAASGAASANSVASSFAGLVFAAGVAVLAF